MDIFDMIALKNKASLGEKANQSALDSANVNIAAHTSQIASLASGSPKGVYTDLAAVTTAFPSGNSNIYITSGNGHWCYWNGSAWTDGGTYQSTGITDDIVGYNNVSVYNKNIFNKTIGDNRHLKINDITFNSSVVTVSSIGDLTQGDISSYNLAPIFMANIIRFKFTPKVDDNNWIVLGGTENDYLAINVKVSSSSITGIKRIVNKTTLTTVTSTTYYSGAISSITVEKLEYIYKFYVNDVYAFSIDVRSSTFDSYSYIRSSQQLGLILLTSRGLNTSIATGCYVNYFIDEKLSDIKSELDLIDVNNLASTYKNKYLSILGDSISTFTGYVPSGNAVYYTGSNCGVSSVDDTWWMKLMVALEMNLLINNSWSGSYVTTVGGDASAGCMTRCQNLHTAEHNPDVIIVYMGINDFMNEVTVGDYNGSQAYPTVTTTFREAYAIMLGKILTAYPQAEVWCATLQPIERNGSLGFPEANDNGVLLETWNNAIRDIASLFSLKILEHGKCGLTYYNRSIYTGDYGSAGYEKSLHPNALGMSLIANNDIRQMDNAVRTRY